MALTKHQTSTCSVQTASYISGCCLLTEKRPFLSFCSEHGIVKPSNLKRADDPRESYHFAEFWQGSS